MEEEEEEKGGEDRGNHDQYVKESRVSQPYGKMRRWEGVRGMGR